MLLPQAEIGLGVWVIVFQKVCINILRYKILGHYLYIIKFFMGL